MKELERKLANPSQTPYSKGVPRFNRGGDIFMATEGSQDMPPNSQPTNPEHSKGGPLQKESVSAERQEAVRKAWKESNGERVVPVDEKRIQEELIKRGVPPIAGGAQEQGEENPPPPPVGETKEQPQQPSSALESSAAGSGGGENPPAGMDKEASSPASFRQELDRLSEQAGQAGFSEIQQFLRTASTVPITTREQLEEMHRDFSNSSNKALFRITGEFGEENKELFEEFARKRLSVSTDKEREDLGKEFEVRRNSLVKEFRGRNDRLRDTHSQFLNVLEKKFGSGRRGLSLDQQTMINAIDLLEKASETATTEEHRNEIRRELGERLVMLVDTVAPQDEPLPDEILIAIGKDAFASEKFLDKVIRLSGEDEQYHLPGMFSDVNVNKFIRVNESLMESRQKEHVQNLRRGTEALHEMNRILKTNLDQFAQISQMILPEHLTTIFRLPGVQDVFELYEGVIKENLSIETMITDDVFKKIDEQVEKEFKEVSGKQILIAGERSHITKSYKGDGGLEPWEVERAISYGRNIIRTLLREGEYISFSHIPEAQRAFISLAQGQLQGVFNPVTYTQNRFKPGESQGGIEMLDAVLDKALKKRRHGRDENKEASKGIVRLLELSGTSVGDREATKYINARGYLMTWRATEAVLRELALVDNGRVSNITQFFEDHKTEISVLKEISSSNAWESEFKRTGNRYEEKNIGESEKDYAKRREKQLDDWKRKRIEQVFGPLLNNSAVAQGALVSSLLTVPTEVKEILWERISELNPDVMASFLTRLEVDEDAEESGVLLGENRVKSLEEILSTHFDPENKLELFEAKDKWKLRSAKKALVRLSTEGIVKLEVRLQDAKTEVEKSNIRAELEKTAPEYDQKKREVQALDSKVKRLLRSEEWVNLRKKLRTINRLRMLDEKDRIGRIKALKPRETAENIPLPKKFADYTKDQRLFKRDRLTDKEISIVSEISQNGRKISRDLSNIQQSSIWFLDDVPTDNIRWESLGQTFNRMISDFGNFASGANELNAWLFDPFKMKAETAREHQAKAILGPGQILGVEAVQDNLNPFIMMYNKWTRTYPRFDQSIINMIWSAREKYTSKAQEVSRDISALSLDEDGMHKQLLEQNHASIIRKEKRDAKTGKIMYGDLYKKAEKELRADMTRRFLWANLKNYGPFFLLGMIISLFQGITAKKQ